MSYNELENNCFVQELNFVKLYKSGVDKVSACMMAFHLPEEAAKFKLSTMNLEMITSEAYINGLTSAVKLMNEYVTEDRTPLRR